MTVLLDTHALLWFVDADPRLPTRVADRLEDETCFVSAVTAWELAIKTAMGKLRVASPVGEWLPRQLDRNAFEELPVTVRHASGVQLLPPLHTDPFDRLLVAQATAEGLTLVTGDAAVQAYDVDWFW